MRYAMLINDDPTGYAGRTPDELTAHTAEYLALTREPGVVDSAQLAPGEAATTVRVDAGGQLLLTDGPFADTKEVFAGYYVVEAADLDEALAFAARIPAARLGGAVEVRPLAEH